MATIRPIINYRNATSYYIAKIPANWLKQNFDLPFKYNVKNSIECAEIIKEPIIQPTYKMLALDITNLYTNIPINETINLITTNACLDSIVQNEVMELIKITMSQNCFEFDNVIWQQEHGTPMGSPISNILLEIFLQHL
jgi:hypothetical protein